jgi:RHS repeat-associated protein
MKSCRFLLTLVLLVGMSSLALGQAYNGPETGEKILGTYFATDIDSVSLTNGNLHLRIPIFSLPGREIPAALGVEYDSQAYEVRQWCTPSCTYGHEGMQWKKSGGLPTGRLNYPSSVPVYMPANWGGPFTIQLSVSIVWGPPNGSRYTFWGVAYQSCTSIVNFNCIGATPWGASLYDNLTLQTNDSEFVELKTGTHFSSGASPAFITFKDGNRFQVPTAGTAPLVTTTNGNSVQSNINSQTTTNFGTALGDYVPASDTLGRTISYQKNGLTETITLQDANGQPQVYQIVSKSVHGYSTCEPQGFTLDTDFIVVDYVQLPNGKRYTFEYNSEGMVSKVILPSSAYIRYVYAHPVGSPVSYCNFRAHVSDRYVSATGNAVDEKRTRYTYTYTYNPVLGLIGPIRATTVEDPVGNQTRNEFYAYDPGTEAALAALFNTQAKAIISLSSSGNVLKRVDRAWSGSQPHLDSETTTMSDLVRKTVFTYDSYNNVTRHEEFDWGTHAPGPRMRYVDRTYLTPACTSSHICNKVTSETTYTDSNVAVAQTIYEYDNYSSPNTLVSRSGTIPGWTSPTGVRANVTGIGQWLNTNNSWLVTTQRYDVLGNMVKVTDPGGHATETEYDNRFSSVYYTPPTAPTFAFPTKVTEPSGLYVETTYDFNTGVVTQTKDQLNRITTKTYDLMNRELQTNFPNGGFTTYCYNDPTPSAPCYNPSNISVRKQVKVDTSGNLGTVIAHYDGLYREIKKETYDPEGTIFVETQYDANSRKWKVSNPRRSAETAVWTESAYDVLDRPSVTTAPDNSTVQYAYSGNQTTVTDEAGNQRRYTYDGLGQMTKVEEPNPSLATPLVTTYTYNVLGKMTQSNQSNQIRQWAFDSLGRMTSETLPESGTTNFDYTLHATNNPDSQLRTKTDARGIVTTLNYGTSGGGMHQLVSRSYSDSTPAVSFNYNTQGLRNSMTDGLGSVTYTYDANTDRLSQESRTLTGVSGTFTTAYVYNIKGDLTSMTYPSGRVVNFNYATGGGCCNSRLSSVVDQTTGATMTNGMTFNAAGELLTRTLNPGTNAIQQSLTHNSRLQLTQVTSVVASTTVMNFTYNYGTATTNTGRVLSRTDAIQPEHSMAYGYDSIYRLSQAISQDSSWDISWAFDVWGNRTSQVPRGLATSKVGTQTLGYSNNRNISNTYDNAGNQTNDGLHNYTFNAENQITQMDGGAASYAHDGEGRRMKKTVGSETTYYFYGPGGLLCEFTTSNTISSATSASSTDRKLHRTSDKLGSAVLVINSSGLVIENNRTLPYGEAWIAENTPSTNDKKFTTYDRDKESGLDYAMARMYGNVGGRFNSPDQGEITLSGPVTLNRYLYTAGDPINYTDPTGKIIAVIQPQPRPPAPVVCPGGYVVQGGSCVADISLGLPGSRPIPLYSLTYVTFDRRNRDVAGVRGIFSRLQGLLKGDQSGCATFIAGWGGLRKLDEKMKWLLDGNRIGVGSFRDGLLSAPSAVATPDQKIIIGINMVLHNGPYGLFFGNRIGSERNLAHVLLHELAHVVGVIPDDGLDSGQSLENSRRVVAKCSDVIGKFGI